jgi:hypothetical protein
LKELAACFDGPRAGVESSGAPIVSFLKQLTATLPLQHFTANRVTRDQAGMKENSRNWTSFSILPMLPTLSFPGYLQENGPIKTGESRQVHGAAVDPETALRWR